MSLLKEDNYMQKYRDFIPDEALKIIEEVETHIGMNRELGESVFYYQAITTQNNENEIFRSFYKILSNLSLVLANNFQDVPTETLQNLKRTLHNIVSNNSLINLSHKYSINPEDELRKEYILGIIMAAKSILGDIINYEKTPKKKFKTVDEMLEYWSEKYDEDEVTKSLEILEEAIDEERRRKGGRTIFS